MKWELVSTGNVAKIMEAARSLEGHLGDSEIMGMGLIYGQPGLGKSMATRSYHVRSRKEGKIRTVYTRALGIWSETTMLKWLLSALGISPYRHRKDVMFDQIHETLRREPAVILIDEADAMSESRKLIAILKDIHDLCGASIMLIGEERVAGVLRRYQSFYDRMNTGAVVHLTGHSVADVAAVLRVRCEVEVAPEVSEEIHRTVGRKTMRAVIDMIREIEAFAKTNKIKRIGDAEFKRIMKEEHAIKTMVKQQMEAQVLRPAFRAKEEAGNA